MDRKDYKSSRFVGQGRGGSAELDTSTVELSGTSAEATIIVQALGLLVAEKHKQEILTGVSLGVSIVEDLLRSIETPNIVPVDLQKA